MKWDSTIVLKRDVVAYWSADPINRPVKITNIVRDPMFWTEGYVTSYKFVTGRSLPEVEKILGLIPGDLKGGAYFYEFLRLPTPDEFDLKGYTQCPGGQNWTPKSNYPAGTGAPQWAVKYNSFVPSRLVAIINSDERTR